MQKNQIIINNLVINYYQNTQEKPDQTLVFLHGWRSNAQSWFYVLKALAHTNNSIYALDLPGFGESQAPKSTFCLQDYADIVIQFIEKLNLENVCLVGHSFGGRVAIKITALKSGLINKLILADSAGKKNTSTSNKTKIAISKLVKPFFKLPGTQKLRKSIYKKIGAEDYIATPELKQTFINIINEDLMSLLPSIVAPTLIIWGQNDHETPLKLGQQINQMIPNSKLVIIPKAGHFSFLDQPEKFTQHVTDFLQTSKV